jgi:DNA-binding CsgD family transcriptional regulator
LKHGKYIAEFLAESVICDEVGVLLADGPGWCLGIFLDSAEHRFSSAEIESLKVRFSVFEALHELDTRSRSPDFMRTAQPSTPGREPTSHKPTSIPEDLWTNLSARERQLVQLILSGYPTASIAKRLGLSLGTVKNHRHRIYEKLDITTERELFLQYFEHQSSSHLSK